MEVNGWRLFQYPLFENQLKKLAGAVEQLSITQPDTFKEHPKSKLLATIHRLITERIPRDPNAVDFGKGMHWDLTIATGFEKNFTSAIAFLPVFIPG